MEKIAVELAKKLLISLATGAASIAISTALKKVLDGDVDVGGLLPGGKEPEAIETTTETNRNAPD